jgi:hypothetical protein
MDARMRLPAICCALVVLGTGCDRAATAGSPAALDTAPVEACREAFADQMGVAAAQVEIRNVTRTGSGMGMLATIDGAEVPWECMTDLSGEITALSFTGTIADN